MDQNIIIEKTVQNLRKNNFIVQTFKNRTELNSKLLDDLRLVKSVSRGGSVTIDELQIIEMIKESGIPFRDYKDPIDRLQSLTAEAYLTSTNAITMDGTQLLWMERLSISMDVEIVSQQWHMALKK